MPHDIVSELAPSGTLRVGINLGNILLVTGSTTTGEALRRLLLDPDTGDIVGIRDGDYKMVFKEQRGHGLATWQDPWTVLRAPKIFNLRMDPFERMDKEAGGYDQWWAEHMFLMAPVMVKVGQFKKTFEEFPQRMKPGAFVP